MSDSIHLIGTNHLGLASEDTCCYNLIRQFYSWNHTRHQTDQIRILNFLVIGMHLSVPVQHDQLPGVKIDTVDDADILVCRSLPSFPAR